MFGKSNNGFTFIELVVVIMILGIVATMVVPNLQKRLPGYKRKAFVNELNTLLALGWQNALSSQKVNRVFFDFKKRIVKLEEEETGATPDKASYKPVTQAYRKTWYEWPEAIEIKNFIIDGVDEFGRDREVLTIWFYIVPEGLTQEVIINILDTSQTPDIALGLVLNPFTAQLKEYGTFQKP
jgi:prepilin-type N-terminal cleavage/methylation domain-containing protein